MAVEIPVVVDIMGGINNAIKDIPKAMKELQDAINSDQIDLFPHIEENLRKLSVAKESISKLNAALKGLMSNKEATMFAPFDPEEIERVTAALVGAQIELNKNSNISTFVEGLERADFELLQMREHYKALEEQSRRLSTSINGYRERIQELNSQWNQLTVSEKFGSDGKMTAEAQKLYDTFKRETLELEKQGQTLEQIYAKEVRLANAKKNGLQTRQRENAILNSSIKTMAVLQEKERILSDRLSRTQIGSSKYNQLKKDLEDVRREMNALNGDLQKTDNKLLSLIKNSIRLLALHTTTSFIRNVREVTAEFELQKVALGSIIKDTERAQSLFREIKTAAIQSPFEIKDLVSYTKQLSAYQIETEKLFDTTMKLADVSSGLGVDMGRLILAYGQVRAASVLRGQELRQFTEAGIPLVEKLAEKFTELRGEMVSTGEVFQLISERAVPFSMIEEIFDDMTSAGGQFYKMQEKQAKTLAGQWANLKDSVSIMYDEIGNTARVHGAMEDIISGARWMMQHWRGVADAVSVAGTSLLTYVAAAKAVELWTKLVAKAEVLATAAESTREAALRKVTTSIIGKTAAEKLSTFATNMHTAALARAAAATTAFSKTMWRLAAALATNPFGILALTVGGLIALFTSLNGKVKETSQLLDESAQALDAFNKTSKETDQMIDRYEELSKKESLTAKEAAELKDISYELAAAFPKTTQAINEQTGALTMNVEELRKYNEEAQKAAIAGLEAQTRENEKQIKRNNKKIEKLQKENTTGWGRDKRWSLLSPFIKIPLSDKRLAENTAQTKALNDENAKLIKQNQEIKDTLNGVSGASDNATESLSEWQKKLNEFNKRKDANGLSIGVLSPDQIKGYTKLSDALDDIAKSYKQYAEDEKALKASIKGKSGQEQKELEGMLARATARKNLAKEELDYYNAFYLTQKKGSKGSDDHLQRLKEGISDLNNAYKKFVELRKVEGKDAALADIATMFPALKGWEPTYENMISVLEKMLASYKGDADATRIIEQAIANIKFDKAKKEMEDKLQKLSEDIARSQAARDFFDNIFDLTGDSDLAATMSVSIYGTPGEDFKERVQRELYQALNSIDKNMIDNDLLAQLIGDSTVLDFDDLFANLDELPEEVQKIVKKLYGEVQQYNAGIANNYAKLLLKFDEIEQQKVNITQQAAKDRLDVEKGLALEIAGIEANESDPAIIDQKKKAAEARAKAVIEAINRDKDLQLSQLEKDYRLFFSSIGTISEEAARRVATNQKRMLTEQFEKHEITYSQYVRELNRVNEQLEKYEQNTNMFRSFLTGGFDSITSKYKEMANSLRAISNTVEVKRGEGGIFEIDQTTMDYIDKIGAIMGGKVFEMEGVSGRKNVASQLVEAIAKVSKDTDDFKKKLMEALDMAAEKSDSFATSFAQGMSTAGFWVTNVSTLIKELDAFNQDALETPKWLDALASTVTWTLGKGGEGAWDRLASLNEYATSGFEKLSQGNIVGAIADNIKGLVEFWGPNVKKINREIKEQSNLLEELEYSYNRLEKAMEQSFGSEYIYNYNQQLELLEAQQAAYLRQAQLEREKGKKADKDAIKEYENAARDTADKIADMQTQLSEFFAGTSLSSAAEDFADAWIDAYKQFGSTTDAMSEKFQDMIDSMINRSLAAKIMQELLQPIFSQIDTMSKDGILSSEEIASISALAQERIPMINDAMTNLMSSLAAAGLDVRTSTAGFKGISRNIANASEESILGLAAGINTQNFYMSYVPTISENVAQILATMTGGVSPTAPVATTETGDLMPSVQQMVYDHLPNIDQRLANLESLFKSVITGKTTSTNTNCVAVR